MAVRRCRLQPVSITGKSRLINTEGNPMTTTYTPTQPATKENPTAIVNLPAEPAQIRVVRSSAAYWRVTIDNQPINVMGPEMVKQFQGLINALEGDEKVKVVVFDSAVDDYFLNHSDFT